MLWRQRESHHVMTSERAAMLWRRTPHNSRSCVSGYAQHIRDGLGEINILQNLQMARLCDIAGAMMFVQLEGHRATSLTPTQYPRDDLNVLLH